MLDELSTNRFQLALSAIAGNLGRAVNGTTAPCSVGFLFIQAK
jgi:hypothetical protein